ncbi:hypothetical protein, partial [Rhodopseudomonas palustris]|uniref:hypothetical protein n=1 Tax=Rhodopseudomonas palustris TaxID=1076 RepID=UPI001AEBBEE9
MLRAIRNRSRRAIGVNGEANGEAGGEDLIRRSVIPGREPRSAFTCVFDALWGERTRNLAARQTSERDSGFARSEAARAP